MGLKKRNSTQFVLNTKKVKRCDKLWVQSSRWTINSNNVSILQVDRIKRRIHFENVVKHIERSEAGYAAVLWCAQRMLSPVGVAARAVSRSLRLSTERSSNRNVRCKPRHVRSQKRARHTERGKKKKKKWRRATLQHNSIKRSAEDFLDICGWGNPADKRKLSREVQQTWLRGGLQKKEDGETAMGATVAAY